VDVPGGPRSGRNGEGKNGGGAGGGAHGACDGGRAREGKNAQRSTLNAQRSSEENGRGAGEGWRLVIAGPDEQGTLARLKAQAERLGLRVEEKYVHEGRENQAITPSGTHAPSPDILFTGPVYGEAKRRLMAEADLVVLPSRSENFGIVVGEALACEVPVVMTDVGPWREERTRHPVVGVTCCEPWSQNGAIRFVETRADSMASGLTDMMRLSDEERGVRGARGSEWVRATFSWEAVARQMLDLYGLLRPRSGRNGECKNGRGAGEGARLECDRELARGEPVDVPGGPRSGRNGECKNGGGKGEGARGIL